MTAKGEEKLRDLGVRDSKALSPKRREALYPEIRKVCAKVRWSGISPSEIDEVVRRGEKYRRLNYLEAVYFAKVISSLETPKVAVDAADSSPSRFRDAILENLEEKVEVTAAHKADRDDVVVAAASVVAKVQRDRAVERLRRTHGDFGSGYPSDPDTRRFFASMVVEGRELPSFVRRSWKTWDVLVQTSLPAYIRA